MACGRNQSSSISPSLSISELFEATTTSNSFYASPPRQSRSDFFSAFGGYLGFNILLNLVFSCVVCMDLVSPMVNRYFGCLFRDFSSSFVIFCCVSSVENKVICRVRFLHSKFLRRVLCLPSREAGCGVSSDSYLRRVLCSPTRVTDCLNLVSVPLLMSWSVCDLMNVCWKYGDDLFQKIYYHKSVLHFSGRWKSSDGSPREFVVCKPGNMRTRFGFWRLSFVEEGLFFFGSVRKNSYRVVDQSSSIQTHPWFRRALLLLLHLDSGDKRFWLQAILVTSDSGYIWILVTHGNHCVSSVFFRVL